VVGEAEGVIVDNSEAKSHAELSVERTELERKLDAMVYGLTLANAQLHHLAQIQRTANVSRAILQKQRANISQRELKETLCCMTGDELAAVFVTTGRAN
jgi:hypothetical protein